MIENGFCRKLCLRLFPEVSRFTCVTEGSSSVAPSEVGTSNSVIWESLEREHRVYAHLAQCLISPMTTKDCIETSIRASSTDNDPEENIENTLDPRQRVDARHSYWSSTGTYDPEVPETLTYKLRSQLCVINAISIMPFKGILILPHEHYMSCMLSVVIFFTDIFFLNSAIFQIGNPIYSSKAVRFRMGHPKFPLTVRSMSELVSGFADDIDNYVWTYISPKFPMVQVN